LFTHSCNVARRKFVIILTKKNPEKPKPNPKPNSNPNRNSNPIPNPNPNHIQIRYVIRQLQMYCYAISHNAIGDP